MAEQAGKTGQDPVKAAPRKGGLSLGLVILGVALLVIATTGSAFLAVTFLGRSAVQPQAAASPSGGTGKSPQFGPTQEIGNFTVNLADPRTAAFVKAGVAVEVSNAEAAAELTARDPQVKDIVIGVLSSRTTAEVSTPEGKEALKREIRDKLNRLLSKGRVKNVFFTEFVFQ